MVVVVLTEITLNPTRRNTLRNHTNPLVRNPSDQHLRWVSFRPLGDGFDFDVVYYTGFTGDVVAEGGVGCEVDVFFFGVGCVCVRGGIWM